MGCFPSKNSKLKNSVPVPGKIDPTAIPESTEPRPSSPRTHAPPNDKNLLVIDAAPVGVDNARRSAPGSGSHRASTPQADPAGPAGPVNEGALSHSPPPRTPSGSMKRSSAPQLRTPGAAAKTGEASTTDGAGDAAGEDKAVGEDTAAVAASRRSG